MAMKAYKSYKNTEYDWLPRIPTHWTKHSVREITSVSSERNENTFSRDDLLSVYREYGVIKKFSRDDNHNVESLDLSKYKTVHINYLVINKMKMWQGSLGISQYDGIVSPAYIVCKLNLANINYYFIHALLRAATFKTFYNRISYGVRVGQWDASYEDLKSLNLYLPPKEEQDQIVRYLDWQNSRLNKLINAKKKEIALLEEQKQALISQAVTKGLDPNAPLKDSGIDWIGKIPEYWEIKRLGSLFQQRTEKVSDKAYMPLSVTKNGVVPQLADAVKTNNGDNRKLVCVGDFVINSRSDRKGSSGLSRLQGSVAVINLVLKPTLVLEGMYTHYLLRCNQFVEEYYRNGRGIVSDLWTTIFSDMKTIWLPVPPKNEQQSIVQFLNELTDNFSQLINSTEEQVSLLKEYRTRLVADVVTGQIDVRNIAIPNYEPVTETIDQPEATENENNTTEE